MPDIFSLKHRCFEHDTFLHLSEISEDDKVIGYLWWCPFDDCDTCVDVDESEIPADRPKVGGKSYFLAGFDYAEHGARCANCGAVDNWVTTLNPGTRQYCGSCGAHR